MTAVYLDTSVIVSVIAVEPESGRARSWLRRNPAPIIISDWTVAEVASALSLKLRSGAINASVRAGAEAAFQVLLASFDVVAIERGHFRTAAVYAGRHDAALRAPDALHLAVCASLNAAVATFDLGMVSAASVLGIPVADL